MLREKKGNEVQNDKIKKKESNVQMFTKHEGVLEIPVPPALLAIRSSEDQADRAPPRMPCAS